MNPTKAAADMRSEMKKRPGSWDRFRRAKGARDAASTATTAPGSS
jgi:hypothetical protein